LGIYHTTIPNHDLKWRYSI